MQMQAGTQRTSLRVLAGAVAGLVVGYVLGAAVGWPPLPDPRPDNGAMALMCTALDDPDAAFLQSMADDEMSFRTSADRRMAVSLLAAADYAELAAQAGEGDDELLATADDLRIAMQQLQSDVAREHVDALRVYC